MQDQPPTLAAPFSWSRDPRQPYDWHRCDLKSTIIIQKHICPFRDRWAICKADDSPPKWGNWDLASQLKRRKPFRVGLGCFFNQNRRQTTSLLRWTCSSNEGQLIQLTTVILVPPKGCLCWKQGFTATTTSTWRDEQTGTTRKNACDPETMMKIRVQRR